MAVATLALLGHKCGPRIMAVRGRSWVGCGKGSLLLGFVGVSACAFFTDWAAFRWPGVEPLQAQLSSISLKLSGGAGKAQAYSVAAATSPSRSAFAEAVLGNQASLTVAPVTEPVPTLVVAAMAPTTSPLAPTSPTGSPGSYVPIIYRSGRECLSQASNFGHIQTPEHCDELAAAEADCGATFMFSVVHSDWHCRCCTVEGADDGPMSQAWDVYKVQHPRSVRQEVLSNGGYQAKIRNKGRECSEQSINMGRTSTPAECDQMVALTPECGGQFMFNKAHPQWQCRCCAAGGADDGPTSPTWNVYEVQSPRPKSFPMVPTLPAIVDPLVGLPVASGPRPRWLVKEDALVVDARTPAGQGGGILILQPVLMDARSEWGRNVGSRPQWLRAILATNSEHARKHGHAMVLRGQPSQPQLTSWQLRACGKKSTSACVKHNERENFNWEKHMMMSEYLQSSQNFSHVLMLDADAALIQPDHDTLREIADLLESKKKDLFLTDEDWLEYGEGRINGGLMFAKNTPFTRAVFQDTFRAHQLGPLQLKKWQIGATDIECSSNEQICLNDLWRGQGKPHFAPFTIMASGKKYNRGAERGGVQHINDPEVEIMHWMGGSKSSAGQALCHGRRDLTGGGPDGYGCKPS